MKIHNHHFARMEAILLGRQQMIQESKPEALECRKDFIKFRQYVCNHESPDHHMGWESILNTGLDSKCLTGIGGKHTLILAPRGSAKSTFLVEWISWVIGNHTSPEILLPIKILYVSYSIEVAMLKSEQIQEIIMSPKYQDVFPWVKPSKKWGQKIWDIDKTVAGLPTIGEPYTLSCAGLKGAVASKRAHLCAFDDLVKSPEQIDNPSIREKMANNWSNVIRPVMYEGARAICLGTRMRADDIYESTFNPERGWEVITQGAITEDDLTGEEKSYWEIGTSLKYLQHLREDDPTAFALQYMNVIPSEGEGVIAREWVKDGIPPDLSEFDSLCIGSDLSSSLKDKADYTVFLLLGKKGDEYWVLDIRRGRWGGNIDKFSVLVAMLLEWGILDTKTEYEVDYRTGKITWLLEEGEDRPRFYSTGYYVNVFMEAVSYQLSFKSDWETHVQGEWNIYSLTCLGLKIQGDKLQRLRGVTGCLQKGQVYWNKYRKHLKRAKQELLGFGTMGKDDCVDALVLGLVGMGARPRIDVA